LLSSQGSQNWEHFWEQNMNVVPYKGINFIKEKSFTKGWNRGRVFIDVPNHQRPRKQYGLATRYMRHPS